MELQPHLNLSLEDMPNEVWEQVKGYEGLYEVSNFGRVKSIPRNYLSTKGNPVAIKQRILMQIKEKGYLRTHLCQKGKSKLIFTHRLVASSFFKVTINQKDHVCHKDNNPLNNNVSNLYVGDCITNTKDKYTSNKTKIKIEDVIVIRNSKESIKNLSIKYNICEGYVYDIRAGRRCTHEYLL